ncbi:MAG TPA: CocE/NonD family hydrolase [Streptosporangiaceae bacterium]|nr:CocE/NonD family hydrolase [Streptosporangiaceae bacterium]
MTPWRLFDVQVPMADGVSLSTDVVLPAAGAGPWPAILIRTPYSKVNDRILGWADFFADYGYAVVAQDVRGRGDSDGVWEPWISEFGDGYDAVEWIAAQPWCTGKVGMLGGSYEGWVQWAAASRHPAHLAAMVTSGSPGRWFRDWPYRFGAFFASDYLEWLNLTARRVVQPFPFPSWAWYVSHPSLRRLDADMGRPLASWQTALDHSTYDNYWHSLDITGYEQMDIPVLHLTGWFDGCAPGEFHHFRQMRERSPAADRQSLVVGPWDHGGAVVTGLAVEGDLAISAQGTADLRLVWERWFARFLKGEPASADGPAVRYYSLGANEWRESSSWPPAGSKEHVLYLHADGTASTSPSPTEAAREYEYDPARPVLSMLMPHNRDRLEWAPRPGALIDGRADVLRYRAAPAEVPLAIAGPVRAVLFAATTGPDTDFVVSLGYVRADGSTTIVADGIVRAAMRSSLEEVALLEPGQIYELDIEVNDIALELAPGEALEVAISSSLAPNYHPNPNTGLGYAGDAPPIVVRQSVFHGGHRPSRLVLHVVPAEGADSQAAGQASGEAAK